MFLHKIQKVDSVLEEVTWISDETDLLKTNYIFLTGWLKMHQDMQVKVLAKFVQSYYIIIQYSFPLSCIITKNTMNRN